MRYSRHGAQRPFLQARVTGRRVSHRSICALARRVGERGSWTGHAPCQGYLFFFLVKYTKRTQGSIGCVDGDRQGWHPCGVPSAELESAAFCSASKRSVQLSYEGKQGNIIPESGCTSRAIFLFSFFTISSSHPIERIIKLILRRQTSAR